MQREIGSNFWLDPNMNYDDGKTFTPDLFGISYCDYRLLSSGRGAQKLIIDTIKDSSVLKTNVVLIPPFTCYTVVLPFVNAGFHVETYDVDAQLNTTPDMLEAAIKKYEPAIVLIHGYYGRNTLRNCEEIIQKFSGEIWFIEDRTQTLYSNYKELPVHFVLASLRKWAGLMEGGIAISKSIPFRINPANEDGKVVETKKEASYLKYYYMTEGQGEKSKFREKYIQAENTLHEECELYKMSTLSQSIQAHLNLMELKSNRRKNYNYLNDALAEFKSVKTFFGEMKDGEVPLYIPLLCNKREELQNALREKDIYAPFIWPKDYEDLQVCSVADYIYDRVICIPIDQRYDIDDMRRVVAVIRQWENQRLQG